MSLVQTSSFWTCSLSTAEAFADSVSDLVNRLDGTSLGIAMVTQLWVSTTTGPIKWLVKTFRKEAS